MRPASRSLARKTLQSRRLHATPQLPPVKITTLPNKIRVATESTPGHFSSLGLYVDAGSRYETAPTSGVSHFLDRLAFKVCKYSLDRFVKLIIIPRQLVPIQTQKCCRLSTNSGAKLCAHRRESR